MKSIHKQNSIVTMKIITFSLLLVTATASVSRAAGPFEDYNRKGKFEVYGFGQYQGGDTAKDSSSGITATIKLDSSYSGGVGGGYNINDYLNIHTELAIGTVSFKGTVSDPTVSDVLSSGDATTVAGNFGLDYNILKKRLTPLLTAGVGFINYNGDGTASDPTSNDTDTYGFSETDISYYVGAGVRWDITDRFYAKLVYRPTWTSLKDADNTMLLHTVTASFGFSF